jgi:hypothetical protein
MIAIWGKKLIRWLKKEYMPHWSKKEFWVKWLQIWLEPQVGAVNFPMIVCSEWVVCSINGLWIIKLEIQNSNLPLWFKNVLLWSADHSMARLIMQTAKDLREFRRWLRKLALSNKLLAAHTQWQPNNYYHTRYCPLHFENWILTDLQLKSHDRGTHDLM